MTQYYWISSGTAFIFYTSMSTKINGLELPSLLLDLLAKGKWELPEKQEKFKNLFKDNSIKSLVDSGSYIHSLF